MVRDTPSIAIIAGEASGDLQGARLAAEIRERIPTARIWGVGGRRMREAGVDVRYDSSAWSAIGATEALRLVPRLLCVLRRLGQQVMAEQPDVIVPIDFGAFNVRLLRRFRPPGSKVLYYFPPGSWNRYADYSRLNGIADLVVTPFPWSADGLRGQGFSVEFFGHPLLDTVRPTMSREAYCAYMGLDAGRCIVGLLPGSRAQELRHNLPAMLIAAARLRERHADAQFVVPLAHSVSLDALAGELARVRWLRVKRVASGVGQTAGMAGLRAHAGIRSLLREDGLRLPAVPVDVHLAVDITHDALAYADAAVVASGTATVEAAILGCPMVIVYRGNRLTALEYRLRCRNIRFIGMPNIIADRRICPELIHTDASPARIADLMLPLIADSPERERMRADLANVRSVLGSPGAVAKTADEVLGLLGMRKDFGNKKEQNVESTTG